MILNVIKKHIFFELVKELDVGRKFNLIDSVFWENISKKIVVIHFYSINIQ